jgi:hypothetical protein
MWAENRLFYCINNQICGQMKVKSSKKPKTVFYESALVVYAFAKGAYILFFLQIGTFFAGFSSIGWKSIADEYGCFSIGSSWRLD